MAMDLNAKAAYIRGLMSGMEFDANSKNGKIIAAMMDLLEEMAATVTEHDNALDQVYDELVLTQPTADPGLQEGPHSTGTENHSISPQPGDTGPQQENTGPQQDHDQHDL